MSPRLKRILKTLAAVTVPILVGLLLDFLSTVGTGIAMAVAFGGAVVFGGVTLMVIYLRELTQMLIGERRIRASQAKHLTRWIDERLLVLRTEVEELSDRIVRPHYERYALLMKENIEVISKHREIVIDVDGEGRDLGITSQEITVIEGAAPVDKFPVIITTDVLETTFEDLRYRVGPTATHTPGAYSRQILERDGRKLLQFAIQNDLNEPLHHGQVIKFWHQTCAKLLDPRADWVGIEGGGIAIRISTKIWFPDDSWQVTKVCAYKGVPGDDEKAPDPNLAKVDKGKYENEDRFRTYIEWGRASPEPNQRYFVEWQAQSS